MAEEETITMENIQALLEEALNPVTEKLTAIEERVAALEEEPADDEGKPGEEKDDEIKAAKAEAAEALVDAQIMAGKVVPAQKEAMTKLALADTESFKALMKDAPIVVDLEARRSLLGLDDEEDDEELSDDEKLIASVNLLSNKPVIYAANLSEKDYENKIENCENFKKICDYVQSQENAVFPICAKFEEELIDPNLSDEDKNDFLKDLGLKESGLTRIIKTSYDLLGLISYLTAGEDEVRAWTIKKGTKAPQAAGKIHTDFERGFICAEVINFDEFIKCKNLNEAKEKGLMRTEGKQYEVCDGDIILFRFNV